MKKTIEGRELIALENLGVTIRGTYHKPLRCTASVSSDSASQQSVGILFINGLYATRSSNGDAAIYWADSFAARGYHCFRIDLPGYGDSEGDPPQDWLGFINRGGYAPAAVAVVKELIARFRLPGFIVIGHCAGAVSAIYTAAAAGRLCLGMVLMDPYFHLPQEATPGMRQSMRVWALRSRLGGKLSRLFDCAKHAKLLFRRNALPANANRALLRCWKSLASTGIPILFLKTPGRESAGIKPRLGEFDYFRHVLDLSGRKSNVTVMVMEGANHSFSNRAGRNAVCKSTECWLADHFPPKTSGHETFQETMPALA